MPFPLIAAALGAAGSAISAGINQSAYDYAAAAARKAGRLGVNAYNKAGNIGSNAATSAANVGSTAATNAAGQQVAGYNQALDAVRSATH
jgi:hypothetical protein